MRRTPRVEARLQQRSVLLARVRWCATTPDEDPRDDEHDRAGDQALERAAAPIGVDAAELFVARIWAARAGRIDDAAPPTRSAAWCPTVVPVASDEGIRVQTLEALARLRDSGALTQDEYDAEKNRVLDGR